VLLLKYREPESLFLVYDLFGIEGREGRNGSDLERVLEAFVETWFKTMTRIQSTFVSFQGKLCLDTVVRAFGSV
jgi:hypothetical protein